MNYILIRLDFPSMVLDDRAQYIAAMLEKGIHAKDHIIGRVVANSAQSACFRITFNLGHDLFEKTFDNRARQHQNLWQGLGIPGRQLAPVDAPGPFVFMRLLRYDSVA